MSWLFRGRGSPSKVESPGSEKKAGKPTKAHLGETSKFYYNEKLKRWCVEGEEGDEGESSDAGIAPPPMSRSVSQDYLPADDGRGQGESAATAMSGLNPLTSSSMPGSPRRGASLRQRYYDPGYIGTTKQGSEEDGSVGGSVPALSLPERPSFFGAGGHDAQQPGPGVPNNGGKIPITLFVPQTQDGTGQGGFDENDQVGEGEGNVNGGGGEVPAFSMPWGNETEASEAQSSNGVGALDEGSQQHQHEQDAAADGTAAETAEAAEEAAYPAPAVGLEAYGEDPLFPVQDQFEHLDYDQAKATYFEQKDQQAAYGGEARLDDLIGRLTLEEKGALMGHYDVGDTQYKNLGRATAAGIPRLGIHSYDFGMECNQGMNVGYPQNIGMAATFNRSLLFAAGRGTGIGVRSNANDCTAGLGHCNRQSPGSTSPALSCWSPMINIMRHPLWGRNHEGYGECPYLSGELAAAMVRGLCSTKLRKASK